MHFWNFDCRFGFLSIKYLNKLILFCENSHFNIVKKAKKVFFLPQNIFLTSFFFSLSFCFWFRLTISRISYFPSFFYLILLSPNFFSFCLSYFFLLFIHVDSKYSIDRGKKNRFAFFFLKLADVYSKKVILLAIYGSNFQARQKGYGIKLAHHA